MTRSVATRPGGRSAPGGAFVRCARATIFVRSDRIQDARRETVDEAVDDVVGRERKRERERERERERDVGSD